MEHLAVRQQIRGRDDLLRARRRQLPEEVPKAALDGHLQLSVQYRLERAKHLAVVGDVRVLTLHVGEQHSGQIIR